MSPLLPRGNPDASSASASEKHASSTTASPAPTSVSALNPKVRSCVVCRRRKVRCDKVSPCSNCRRANIACVYPVDDRPPRWARRLERLTNETTASTTAKPSTDPDSQAAQVMERLRSLEALVKELNSQLEQANTASTSSEVGGPGSASSASSPPIVGSQHRSVDGNMDTSSTVSAANVQNQFGRLVLKDANRSRYVSSGFWSRVDVSWPQRPARDLSSFFLCGTLRARQIYITSTVKILFLVKSSTSLYG